MSTASITFDGTAITASKLGLWHVEAGGRSASAVFLDEALEVALPGLSAHDRDHLVVRLLELANESAKRPEIQH